MKHTLKKIEGKVYQLCCDDIGQTCMNKSPILIPKQKFGQTEIEITAIPCTTNCAAFEFNLKTEIAILHCCNARYNLSED